jgi:hypothetical protein
VDIDDNIEEANDIDPRPKWMRSRINKNAQQYFDSLWNHNMKPSSSKLCSFFEDFSSQFRCLYLEFCGVVAASVDVERLWSAAGNILTEKRTRMYDSTLISEMFVKFNSSVEISSSSPRILSKLDLSILFESETLNIINTLRNDVVDINENVDASELECENEVELLELLHDENTLQVEDIDPYWSTSAAPKHFGNSVKELLNCADNNSRKRKASCQNNSETTQKKQKQTSKKERRELCRDWVPSIGDRVLIGYDEDCFCEKEILECECPNVWFEGIVESNLLFDPEKKLNGFNVLFNNDDDHVEFDLEKENLRWILVD